MKNCWREFLMHGKEMKTEKKKKVKMESKKNDEKWMTRIRNLFSVHDAISYSRTPLKDISCVVDWMVSP